MSAAPAAGPVALLIGTKKGAFVLRGDARRARWELSDPILLGHIVHHIVHDVRDGDTVLVRPAGIDRRGRREGRILEVVERAHRRIVGRLHRERGVAFVAAADRRIKHDIVVEPGATGGAKPGQIVTAELVVQPGVNVQPIGRVVEVLGDFGDPGMEIEIALRKHELPFEFSPAAINQDRADFAGTLEQIASDVTETRKLGAAEIVFDVQFSPGVETVDDIITRMEQLRQAA